MSVSDWDCVKEGGGEKWLPRLTVVFLLVDVFGPHSLGLGLEIVEEALVGAGW